MRIIGGKYKGHKLFAVADNGTRPTSDRVKENLYNILSAIGDGFFANKQVLDLFAGTGALGLEALSRGARHCVFIDTSKAAAKVIASNISKLGAEKQSYLLNKDIRNLKFEELKNYKFDIIFADPPYGHSLWQRPLQELLSCNLVSDDCFFILEESSLAMPLEATPYVQLFHRRSYGATSLTICKLLAPKEEKINARI